MLSAVSTPPLDIESSRLATVACWTPAAQIVRHGPRRRPTIYASPRWKLLAKESLPSETSLGIRAGKSRLMP